MIMKGKTPGCHKGICGNHNRPNMHDRYAEDGYDGGNGKGRKHVFRIVVEAEAGK
jgi:hypothetical protein